MSGLDDLVFLRLWDVFLFVLWLVFPNYHESDIHLVSWCAWGLCFVEEALLGMLGMAKHGERDLVYFLVPTCNPCLSYVSCDPCVHFVYMLDTSMHWGHFLASSVMLPLSVVVLVQHCYLRNRRMLLSDVFCDVVV